LRDNRRGARGRHPRGLVVLHRAGQDRLPVRRLRAPKHPRHRGQAARGVVGV